MNSLRTLSLGLLLIVPVTPLALAQGPAPQAGPSPHSRHDDMPPRGRGFDGRGPGLPGGMWWKDDAVVKAIALTADQKKKIDDIFLQSRVQLIHLHAALEEQETLLGPIMDANPIDQGKASAQIDKIAETRADLEKTNAKMLLNIRGVLSADQWTKLREQHRMRRGADGPWSDRDRHGRGGGPDHGQPDGPPPPPPGVPDAK